MKNLVKVERVRRNIQQQELAHILGISRQAVYAMEGGRFVPSTLLALKISKLFQLKVEDLFFLEESEMGFLLPNHKE
jgi:putative transcriptional regulator